MIPGAHTELFLAAYAAFLVGAAAVLELLARNSHRRSDRYRHSGFVYRRNFDLWECPMGQQLTRVDVDYQHRVVRYRAPAQRCNACTLKNDCTDSDEGRLLEFRHDSWFQSELHRFHRGISLSLMLLAMVILFAAAVRHGQPREMAAVGLLLIPLGIAETKLLAAFLARRS